MSSACAHGSCNSTNGSLAVLAPFRQEVWFLEVAHTVSVLHKELTLIQGWLTLLDEVEDHDECAVPCEEVVKVLL